MSARKSKSAKKSARKPARKPAKKSAKKAPRKPAKAAKKPAKKSKRVVVRSQPESLRSRSLSASLTATNLQRSLEWYRDIVGFTVEERHEREGLLRAVTLKAGSTKIVISQDDGALGGERAKGAGFSLYFTTAQNIDSLAAEIKKRGGILTAEPADMYGSRVFRLQDPDGFKLVISSGR